MVLPPEEAGHARSVDEPGRRRQVRLAAAASVVGTSIEWYDFFLYGTAAAIVFPAVFFPKSSPYSGTLESFATYAVGFAARPVGAAIFGHWGDRIGRKATLIVTLLMMGIASALVGALPGTATIGVTAPILLVVLRVFQGIAVGGEWSGSVLLSMEWGKQHRRGLMASWPQIGVPIGLLLGTGAMTAIALSAQGAFKAWAWRIPFLASLLLVGIGLWVRLKVLETPMFAQVVEKRTVSKVPTTEVLRRYPKEVVLRLAGDLGLHHRVRGPDPDRRRLPARPEQSRPGRGTAADPGRTRSRGKLRAKPTTDTGSELHAQPTVIAADVVRT